MKKVLLTGSTGFIGKKFLQYNKETFNIISLSIRGESYKNSDFGGIDVVVHLAGKAHDMNCKDDKEYFDVNYEKTKSLAELVKKAKVPHFIYASTVKVYGHEQRIGLNEQSECFPEDAYGKSKLQAENFLLSLVDESFKVAIIRPPLVYGRQVKGNMARLIEICRKNYYLPFGNMGNKRTIVFVDNLIEMVNAIVNQKVEGIFIPSDKHPVSTDQLIIMISDAIGAKTKLFAIPKWIRGVIKTIFPLYYKRLFESFIIDASASYDTLKITPKYSTAEGIKDMCSL